MIAKKSDAKGDSSSKSEGQSGQNAGVEELKVDFVNEQDLSEEARKMASTTYNLSKKEDTKKE